MNLRWNMQEKRYHRLPAYCFPGPQRHGIQRLLFRLRFSGHTRFRENFPILFCIPWLPLLSSERNLSDLYDKDKLMLSVQAGFIQQEIDDINPENTFFICPAFSVGFRYDDLFERISHRVQRSDFRFGFFRIIHTQR